ncbi:phosphonoacetaldehyde hydrolase [Pseudolactococcus reticulitermitis]|nr:phosphonoacetaldehyde hydrolase [Lactococcus reticulitermitis]
MMIEAVIFDWAGTTVDYGCFAPVQAFIETFQNEGIEVMPDEVRQPMGALKRDHIKILLEMPRIRTVFETVHHRPFSEADIDDMLAIFTEKLMAEISDHTVLKPDILETVAYLRDKQIKIGTTTGYTRTMLAPVAMAAKVQGYEPDVLMTPDDVNGVGRPAPDMIHQNLAELAIQNRQSVLKVGDTVADIVEGKNAHVLSVGVIEGSSVMGLTETEYAQLSPEQRQSEINRVRQVFEAAGADAVILNLSELPALIEKINQSWYKL